MKKNPNWTVQETILALDFYMDYRPIIPSKNSKEVKKLSRYLNYLEDTNKNNEKYRNENGVYMKLMNLKYCDGKYKGGLSDHSKLDFDLTVLFKGKRSQLKKIASAIKKSSSEF